jgi:hypothetical protein
MPFNGRYFNEFEVVRINLGSFRVAELTRSDPVSSVGPPLISGRRKTPGRGPVEIDGDSLKDGLIDAD